MQFIKYSLLVVRSGSWTCCVFLACGSTGSSGGMNTFVNSCQIDPSALNVGGKSVTVDPGIPCGGLISSYVAPVPRVGVDIGFTQFDGCPSQGGACSGGTFSFDVPANATTTSTLVPISESGGAIANLPENEANVRYNVASTKMFLSYTGSIGVSSTTTGCAPSDSNCATATTHVTISFNNVQISGAPTLNGQLQMTLGNAAAATAGGGGGAGGGGAGTPTSCNSCANLMMTCANCGACQAPCYCAAACDCNCSGDSACEQQNRASAAALGTTCSY